jgi:predicted membrane protein
MEADKFSNFHKHSRLNTLIIAGMLIIAGGLILGHNLGWISDYVYHIVISWQMLLIAFGVASLIKRNLIGGLILMAVGLYFLLPSIISMEGKWIHAYWPVFLILAGIILLFRKRCPNHFWHRHWCGERKSTRTDKVEDGFVTIDISFGSTRHIVLDPVFRGADIDVSFGSVALDLRRTTLGAPETYIDIDASFGGVELLVPEHWNLFVKSDNSFGGLEDRRHLAQEIDYEHKLIIRGDISFSGVEIKG